MDRAVKSVAGIGVAALIGIVASAGCEKKAETPPPPPGTNTTVPTTPGARAPTDAPADSTIAGATDRIAGLVEEGKEKAEELAQSGLSQVEAKIAELRGRAEAIAEENKPAFERAVADAESRLATLRTRVEELGDAGREEWKQISGDIQEDLGELSKSLSESLARFRGA